MAGSALLAMNTEEGRSERPFRCHPCAQPCVVSAPGNAVHAAPAFERIAYAADHDTRGGRCDGAGAVVVLREPVRPPAVLGRVVAVVVNAVDGEAGRAAPHVGEEVLEHKPTFANFDTPSAVMTELPVPFIVATREHAGPYTVFGRLRAVSRLAVFTRRGAESGAHRSPRTAARGRVTSAQVVCAHNLLRAAVAYTPPSALWGGRYGDKSSEANALQI